jgi:aspartate kinase
MSNSIVVLKFGGSSVGEVRHWDTITQQVALHYQQGCSVVLVLSALKNISNLLEALLHQAVAGVHGPVIERLKEHHLGFAAQLGLSLEHELAPWFEQLNRDCDEIHHRQSISPKRHASILSIGELLSSTIGCAYLKSQQLDCNFQDVRDWLLADDRKQSDPWHHYTSNSCDYVKRADLIDHLAHEPKVCVTQGFIARDRYNDTVLLGREGSDTSAAYLGAMLSAKRVEIWTDVPGVFSFNPRILINARQLSKLTYRQAESLARAGAKVLHPRALAPVWNHHIPLWVKCTAMPQHTGTQLVQHIPNYQGPLAMAGETGMLLVKLQSGDGDALLTELSRLGFDCCQTLAHQQWLLRYTNSDIEQPSDEVLKSQLSHYQLQLASGVCSISVIGQGTDWKAAALKPLERFDLRWINCDEPEQMVCLVNSQAYDDLCRKIHFELFESKIFDTQDTEIIWGDTWQALTNNRHLL